MAGLIAKSFELPDEVRSPDKTKVDVVDLAGIKAARMTAQPGWKWSECIKPLVGTESCQAHHVGVIVSGAMHIRHDDGSESDITSGMAYVIEPDHDAWVIGDVPAVAFEFDSSTAQRSPSRPREPRWLTHRWRTQSLRFSERPPRHTTVFTASPTAPTMTGRRGTPSGCSTFRSFQPYLVPGRCAAISSMPSSNPTATTSPPGPMSRGHASMHET